MIPYDSKYTSIIFPNGVKNINSNCIQIVGEEITTTDILQWDEVREKMEKLFNRRILVQIPETGKYKATMFNMVTKGLLGETNLISSLAGATDRDLSNI